MKTVDLTFYIDSDLKREFETVCKSQGLLPEEAFRLFVETAVREGSLKAAGVPHFGISAKI